MLWVIRGERPASGLPEVHLSKVGYLLIMTQLKRREEGRRNDYRGNKECR